jgi:hypothetical protein
MRSAAPALATRGIAPRSPYARLGRVSPLDGRNFTVKMENFLSAFFFLSKISFNSKDVSLISMVVRLYLILVYVTLAFSPPLTQHGSNSRLQHPGYSPLVSTFSLSISITIPKLTILEFILRTTN